MKIQKKNIFYFFIFFWGGGSGRGGGGGQGRCNREVKFFSQKKIVVGGSVRGMGVGVGGGGVWGVGLGVRLDVNEELKFFPPKKNVNAMLGVGGDVGYRGYEPRIEGIVQCTKRYCTILRK